LAAFVHLAAMQSRRNLATGGLRMEAKGETTDRREHILRLGI